MDKIIIHNETLPTREKNKKFLVRRLYKGISTTVLVIYTIRGTAYPYKIPYYNKGGSKMITQYTDSQNIFYINMESLELSEVKGFLGMLSNPDSFELAITMLDNLKCLRINKSYLINFRDGN